MPDELKETLYGKNSKYEIYYSPTWSSDRFHVYKDGELWRKFTALDAAVEAVNEVKDR